MIYTELTNKALKLCEQAHRGQRDKSGMPYLLHPFHLAEQMDDEDSTCVALLHDTLEDSGLTADDLRAAGIPDRVVEAVELLTHDSAEPYLDYVSRVRENPLARRVKRADLLHNSQTGRLDKVDDAARRRLSKYAEALALLEGRAKEARMFGAVVGDIVGSVYEWDNVKTTEFPLFVGESSFTDDSVMTIAVADALVHVRKAGLGRAAVGRACAASMQRFGRRYPDAGYGGKFDSWLRKRDPEPYNSWGNGSAMRVSPVAWVAESAEEAELLATETALVTHNHPEGVKGARACAAATYLARVGYDNADIRSYLERSCGYDLGFTIAGIRDSYTYDVSCQGSVPQAIVAFLESDSFEDAIRRAISIGGDSDTIAAVTGAMAHARYGIPAAIAEESRRRLAPDLLEAMDSFWQ